MQLSELRDRIYRDCAEAKIGNDRITPSEMDKVINEIYVDVAAQTQCFLGGTTVTVIDNVETYARPRNVTEIICVRRRLAAAVTATPLIADTRKHLSGEFPTYRSTLKGTPERYYVHDGRFFAVWPRPDVTKVDALVIEGYIIPSTTTSAAALNISSSTNASPIVVTIVAHGLLTGQSVTVAGHTSNTGANGIWRITRVSADTFSLDNSVGTGVGGVDVPPGTVTLMGVPPLALETDEPQFPNQYHHLLVHGSVERLLTRFLNDDNPMVLQKAQAAKQDYALLLPRLADLYAGGAGLSVSPGTPTSRR